MKSDLKLLATCVFIALALVALIAVTHFAFDVAAPALADELRRALPKEDR